MIETETKEIGGYSYSVAQLGAKEGRRILVKLTKVIGPALGQLVGAGDPNNKNGNGVDISKAMAGALYELSTSMDEKDLEDLCKVFGQNTEVMVDGKPQLLDLNMQELHFAGKYGDMLHWLGFCIKVNYADFTKALGDLLPKGSSNPLQAVGRKVQKSQSQ